MISGQIGDISKKSNLRGSSKNKIFSQGAIYFVLYKRQLRYAIALFTLFRRHNKDLNEIINVFFMVIVCYLMYNIRGQDLRMDKNSYPLLIVISKILNCFWNSHLKYQNLIFFPVFYTVKIQAYEFSKCFCLLRWYL